MRQGAARLLARAFDRARVAAGVVAVKVVGDSNPNALDAGLDALTAFLQKADEEYASRCAPKPTQKPRRAFLTRPGVATALLARWQTTWCPKASPRGPRR